MPECVQPDAPVVKCCIKDCNRQIKTCLTKRGKGCPVHPEGHRLMGDNFACSEGHLELALQQYDLGILKLQPSRV